ncbi:Rieske (2Fe-2S) protein [Haloglomus salinum]|jgi:nitrite reductase/ring-hydroxylating ferredoxin subunit|uniref:Rieske (2Fe-2S) protein n=1 Tax=Haloglomus salinum TaxID=2962673 RepID=UPI0020C9FC2E|nr:Rieske 2Fe-2S domain-containing protein [Haloglomus salinum]
MEVSDDQRICDVEDVPGAGTFLFTYRDGFDTGEALLVRFGGGAPSSDAEAGGTALGDEDTGIGCWKNYCQHWTDVRLDKGSGARVRDGELWCNKHAATFRLDDGVCTHGPCEGAVLDEVEVTVHDGGVYLTDDRYEFDSTGPDGDRDLSTGSPGGRIDFTGS